MGRIVELLFEILKEIKITNKHLEKLTGKAYRAEQNRLIDGR